MRLRVLPDHRNATAGVLHPILLLRLLVVGVELLIESPLIHHKNLTVDGIGSAFGALLGQHGLLRGVHAADGRAVGVLLIPGAHALKPGNTLGQFAVGGTHHDALRRPRAAGQPLVLHRVDDVGETTESEFLVLSRIRYLITQREDNSADVESVLSLLLVQVHRVGRTDGLTAATGVTARHLVHDVDVRQRARRHLVDRLADRQSHLERAG